MKTRIILLLCILAGLAVQMRAAGTYAITAPDIVGGQGGTATLPVRLYNTLPLRDINVHLRLPEGIAIARDDNGKLLLELNSDLAPDHSITANLNDGFYSIIVSTSELTTITSDNDVLFYVPLTLDCPTGRYEYEFDYVTASQYLDGVVSNIFMANFTGSITVESAVQIADYQFYNPYLITETDRSDNVLGVCLNNPQGVKAFNLDIELPAGIEAVYNADNDDYVEYGDRIPTRFNVFGEMIDGMLNVDGATSRNSSIAAGDGVVFTMNLDINVPEGRYPVVYRNQTVTLTDGTEVEAPDFTGYVIVNKPVEMVNIITYTDEALTASTPRNMVAVGSDGSLAANAVLISDANPLAIDRAFTAKELEYTRTFIYDVWQALYVPFAMDYADWADQGTVAELTGVSFDGNGEATLEWQTVTSGELKPNHPYIFRPAATGKCTISLHNAAVSPTATGDVVEYTDANGSSYRLEGVYEYKYDMFTTGAYGLAPDGNFKRVTSNSVMLKPMRVFLSVGSAAVPASRICNRIIDGTSGVTDIIEGAIDGIYYDLVGRRTEHPAHGLYITRGTKVLVK